MIEEKISLQQTENSIDTKLVSDDAEGISIAAQAIAAGKLVAFPTETVYGLGGNALSPDAAMNIYAAKGRPSDNPLIVHIAETSAVNELATDIPENANALMEAFWPGPLTIILPKKPCVPDATTGGLSTVAIRMPSHPAALQLIRESGVYIAAPSANTSGRPSPTTAQHVAEDLGGRIDVIIDGGPVGIGIESTIVDLTGEVPTILRPGYITKAMLESIVGHVEIDRALIEDDPTLRPKAPGMKYTHYAPKGTLSIVEDSDTPSVATDKVVEKINSITGELLSENKKVVVLTTADMADKYLCTDKILLGEHGNGETVAARLYAALRECDKIGADFILSESFNRDDLGGAIMNRLLKAAGHRVITV